MQRAVERDSQPRSNYAMCAVNPSCISKNFSDAALRVVDTILYYLSTHGLFIGVCLPQYGGKLVIEPLRSFISHIYLGTTTVRTGRASDDDQRLEILSIAANNNIIDKALYTVERISIEKKGNKVWSANYLYHARQIEKRWCSTNTSFL
ncbi:hypothetical protein C8R42DRAFT_587586 [Lentinula raphanica]|nr:hypothetical protein C8R42DRAFT_587586 [Lentinula raphanica]